MEKRLGDAITLRFPTDSARETIFDRLQDGREASLTTGLRLRSLYGHDPANPGKDLFDLDGIFETTGIYTVLFDPDEGPFVFVQARYEELGWTDWQSDLELLWVAGGRTPEDIQWHEHTTRVAEVASNVRFEKMLDKVGYNYSYPLSMKTAVDGDFATGELVILGRSRSPDKPLYFDAQSWLHSHHLHNRFSELGRTMTDIEEVLDLERLLDPGDE